MDAPVSVVIPAYNEASRIVPTLEAVTTWLSARHPGSEVVVVDDGSSDDTVARVEAFAAPGAASASKVPIRTLRLPLNRGKGAAVRAGVLASDRPFVLYTDADLSTPISELIPLFAALRAGADLAIGSRAVRGARVEVRQPIYRVLMGKTFNKLMRAVTWLGVVDSQCGFKLMPREVGHRLFRQVRLDSYAFDVEMLWLARHAGLQVAEVPVRWVNDPHSRVHPVRDSARMLRDVLRIRRLHRDTRP